MTVSNRGNPGRIAPDRWPTEMPLFIAVVTAAVVIWAMLIISVVGILYAVFFGLFFFVSHLVFISQVRGSGVRLGPDQFPDIHRRIVELSKAMDMEPPAAYLMQAGGALNAFATRFLGRNIMVLYSDLLEACGDNLGARDMIIAHELAHLRCGHLRWMWLTLPGHFVPFLGGALSRAREYTCDRFGLAGAGNARDATLGLAILSAGPKFAPALNLTAFVSQRGDTNTGLMTIGEWFGSHPPLSKRIVALDPQLGDGRFHPGRGRALALMIITFLVLGSIAVTVGVVSVSSGFMEAMELAAPANPDGFDPPNAASGSAQVAEDFELLAAFVAQEWEGASLPASIGEIRERWYAASASEAAFPFDPFDGYEYGYEQSGGGYRLWSSGPDGVPESEDDIVFEWPS